MFVPIGHGCMGKTEVLLLHSNRLLLLRMCDWIQRLSILRAKNLWSIYQGRVTQYHSLRQIVCLTPYTGLPASFTYLNLESHFHSSWTRFSSRQRLP